MRPRTRSVRPSGRATSTASIDSLMNPNPSSANSGRGAVLDRGARSRRRGWPRGRRGSGAGRASRRCAGRPARAPRTGRTARRRSAGAGRGRRAVHGLPGLGRSASGRSSTRRRNSSSAAWTRLPLSSGVIMRLSSGFSTGAARRRSSTRWRWGQSAQRSRRVGDVMRSTGDGIASPARLPSKRVKRSLRRAAMTSAPRAVVASSVARRSPSVASRARQPVLLAGGGHVELPQAGVERRDVPHPRLAGGGQVGRPPPLVGAGQVGAGVEDPAGGHPLDAAAQVAAGDAEQLLAGARQRGEELVVLALHAVGPQGQLAAGAGALVVGEEGVVAHGGRERALGQPEDHDQVEVEPDPHLHRADQHAVAEAAHPAEVVLELQLEGAVEHVEGDGLLHGVEGAEAVQGLVDPLRRLALGGVVPPLAPTGAAEEPAEPPLGPRGVLAPPARAGRRRRRGRRSRSSTNCRSSRARVASARSRPARHSGSSSSSSASAAHRSFRSANWVRRWSQSSRPATTAASRDSRSHAGGGREPPAVEDRRRRQPGEHVLAPVAAGGQAEQLEQRAARDPSRRAGRRRRRWWGCRRRGGARG